MGCHICWDDHRSVMLMLLLCLALPALRTLLGFMIMSCCNVRGVCCRGRLLHQAVQEGDDGVGGGAASR